MVCGGGGGGVGVCVSGVSRCEGRSFVPELLKRCRYYLIRWSIVSNSTFHRLKATDDK